MLKAHRGRRPPPSRVRNSCSLWQIIVTSLAIGIFVVHKFTSTLSPISAKRTTEYSFDGSLEFKIDTNATGKTTSSSTESTIITPTVRSPPPPSPPPSPPPPMNPCKIYIVDPSEELAPELGLPKCKLSEAWPFDQPGQGVDGLDQTPHWAARHAAGHWVAEAIRHSSYYTNDIKSADLWYVNTHCYALWHESLWHYAQQNDSDFNAFNPISTTISRLAVDGIMAMKYFTRTAGRRYIISRPTAGSPPGGLMDTCARLKRSFLLGSERAVFCDNNRDRAAHGDSMILPLVVIEGGIVNVTMSIKKGPTRTKFLYQRSRCPVLLPIEGTNKAADKLEEKGTQLYTQDDDAEELKHGASLAGVPSTLGQRFLAAMHAELGNNNTKNKNNKLLKDVDVSCIEDDDPKQSEIIHAMRRAIFCPVLASGSQASRALPAATLTGCIPVFFGPPFHALPFAGDIDYRNIAVFFNITESGKEPAPATEEERLRPKAPGDLEPNAGVLHSIIEVPTFTAAVEYLRTIPKGRIDSMQSVLDKERFKFYYPPLRGKKVSGAGEIMLRKMCEYATKLNVTIAAAQADRAERMDKLPKLHDVVG
ncbi:hypothetical protein Ndes2526B_g04425 [Nannochloris sp. 'desiccata']